MGRLPDRQGDALNALTDRSRYALAMTYKCQGNFNCQRDRYSASGAAGTGAKRRAEINRMYRAFIAAGRLQNSLRMASIQANHRLHIAAGKQREDEYQNSENGCNKAPHRATNLEVLAKQ